MFENNPLSEQDKIPLDHNCTNGAVYSKINFKVEICSQCSALYIFDSLALFPALIRLNPNNPYNHGYHNTFDYNHFTNGD